MSVSGVSTPASGVIEVARFAVKEGSEQEFIDTYRAIRDVLVTTPGCRSARLNRGVESPSTFTLLVEWDTLEAHLETFRNSERFTRWRAALSPYFAGTPAVEHVVPVGEAPVGEAPVGETAEGGSEGAAEPVSAPAS